MPQRPFSIDTSVLPAEALSFYDEKFYEMVERVAGTAEARLLEVQGIRTVYSFLNIEDVFDVLSMPCSALTHIKKSICLQADDDTYMKNEETVKELMQKSKKNKNQFCHLSQSSVIHESMNPDTFDYQTPSVIFDEHYHRDLIIETLNEWFERNRHSMDINDAILSENDDYKILFDFNGQTQHVYISCSCRVKVQLVKNNEHFSLSNYYKHLKTTSCLMMKKKKRNSLNDRSQVNVIDENMPVDEVIYNESINSQIASSSSSITLHSTMTNSRSYKRSSITENGHYSKRKRS